MLQETIRHHLKITTDACLHPRQFTYRANRSADYALNLAIAYILQHQDIFQTFSHIQFVNFQLFFH